MRDIKFQALVVKHALSNLGSNMHWAGIDSYEEIIDVHDISFDNGKIDYVTDKDGDEFSFADKSLKSVRQYTGLKDKNGREIYEGDILKRTVTVVMYGSGKPPKDIDEYLEVEYREDYAGFYIGERPLFAYVDNTRDVDTGCRCSKAEVIGNIYEDPELIESK
ncbi:hypothetical protein CHN56_00125 [Bacillus velezensis]|uniref:YopX family protein n=1 Tax=Bacillus velezensis TaxID=492670 RepID=UPI000B929DE7|nr:YopX family protein [Bacillus velezensis]ASS60670.1 hypothetical protein CHN56_00125 [Bacillus velezensis]